MQKYECFYQQCNKDYNKYSPLKFISKQDPKKFIDVGTILAIPKNPEGSLIVEIIVNEKPVIMSKKSGEDTWSQIEVDTPTQNGFRAAAILSQNKESVEIFANAYVDDLKMMVPLSKQIKNVYFEIMDQRSKSVEKKPSLVVSR